MTVEATGLTEESEGFVRPFRSVLFDRWDDRTDLDEGDEPAYFADLNLDQVVGAITAAYEEYDLAPFLYQPLGRVEAIRYRHQILQDLESKAVLKPVTEFAKTMRDVRGQLAQAERLRNKHQQESWLLDAARTYCDGIGALLEGLAPGDIHSRGLLAFRDYLTSYVRSEEFATLASETKQLTDALSEVTYLVHIRGGRVRVRRFESESDYSADVQRTFEKFAQGAVKDYRVGFSDWPEMNQVEASILELVTRLFSGVFSTLEDYCLRHRNFLDATMATFDREVHFYIAFLEYIEQFRAVGLSFCYPEVSRATKAVFATDTFDLALANKLVPKGSVVVSNDFHLDGPERTFVVSGPNQGGKTTFARTFGQLHHLASIGYLVPGGSARLFMFDKLFAHFEREEDLADLTGKLEDDLVRIRDSLRGATTNSIIILNEMFTSTSLDDAILLGTKVMEQISELDLLCVYVTFLDELASGSESTVSMVSTVVPENPAQRTYKVVRREPDGLSYAAAIAEKYGLTYERLSERISS